MRVEVRDEQSAGWVGDIGRARAVEFGRGVEPHARVSTGKAQSLEVQRRRGLGGIRRVGRDVAARVAGDIGGGVERDVGRSVCDGDLRGGAEPAVGRGAVQQSPPDIDTAVIRRVGWPCGPHRRLVAAGRGAHRRHRGDAGGGELHRGVLCRVEGASRVRPAIDGSRHRRWSPTSRRDRSAANPVSIDVVDDVVHVGLPRRREPARHRGASNVAPGGEHHRGTWPGCRSVPRKGWLSASVVVAGRRAGVRGERRAARRAPATRGPGRGSRPPGRCARAAASGARDGRPAAPR